MDPVADRDGLTALLRLRMVEDIGAVRFANLIEAFGSAERVFEAPEHELSRVPGIGAKVARAIARTGDEVDVAGELELIARHGVTLLTPHDASYPYPLRHIRDCPPLLYVQGELLESDTVAVAIVGSRRCSRYGFEQAERFGRLLARAGVTVVSGLARGIDGAAHRGALAGGGRTIGVLGCGLANTYPPEHVELREQIAAAGAVLSELPMRVEPAAGNFPMRNRIIAGLTLGTLVVEAAGRSGALITARLAAEYNREVFAIPGRIDAPHAQGPHALIRDGAKLVQSLDDILDELGEVGRALRPTDAEPEFGAPVVRLAEEEGRLLEAMDDEPRGIEELANRAGLPLPEVMGLLTQLQLKSQVSQLPGQLFIRRRASR